MNLYTFVQGAREKIKGYKTIIFNALIAVPGGLVYAYSEIQSSGIDVTQYVPVKYVGAAGLAIGILGIVLRIYTSGVLGSKDGLPQPNAPQGYDPIAELQKKEPL